MKNVEDLYPLSPMQQGMLFHTLYDAGLYVEQTVCTLHGSLNLTAFQRAWQQVIERHPVLRTGFVWEGIEQPLQIVRRQARLSWQIEDWRGRTQVEQEALLADFVAQDLQQGFDLSRAPLMRMALFQTDAVTHYFVWNQHHLLLDGWSLPLVLNEVFQFYESFARGQVLALPQPRPYREYIAWLQRQDLQAAEHFWRQTLGDITAATPLTIDRPIHADDTTPQYAGQEIHLALATYQTLQSLARQHGLTLNTIVQGAWALLLGCYSGEDDVVFGTTVSGRPADLPGVETMVGLFINTLPVRVRLQPQAVLLEWLKAIQAQQAEQRQFEYSPLVEIQGWSGVPRGQPLFESLVVFENYPLTGGKPTDGQQPSLMMGNMRSDERSNYPLNIIAAPGPSLAIRVSYDSRRLTHTTIERLLQHFQLALETIAARPDQRLAEVLLLTVDEQRLIVSSELLSEPADQRCLHQIIADQAAQRPDAPALICVDSSSRDTVHTTQLSYAALDDRANQLAHHLQALGVGPDVRVALCLPRSLDLIVSLLAILKAGGAYVPLDPAYPQSLLSFMLADAQAPVLITTEQLHNQLDPADTTVVCLSRDWVTIEQEPTSAPHNAVTPDNLAYIIYTSGSTGQPKGVQVTHRGICNTSAAQVRDFAVQPESHVLQWASLSFDASISEIAMALRAGATLHLAVTATPLAGPDLVSVLDEAAITHVTLPPSVLANLPAAELPALRTLIVAGEACSAELAARWGASRRFINAYGPTETAVCATVAINPSDDTAPPIGRPISNTQVFLLDAQLRPVPVGVPGTIYIAGEGLARGYLGQPALTAAHFIPNPLSTLPGARLYHTGDLGRYRADGQIEFLGRRDHQVKIRGYRIEPGQIEAALSRHPAVREAVVITREDTPGDKRLVAYLVAQRLEADAATDTEHATLDSADLRRVLQTTLPDYMVPSAFVVLDALPLTPNGKVDRRALPAPDGNRLMRTDAFVAPRGPVEEVLASIWADVLRVDQVGAQDDFFSLGGHSLLATQVVARTRATLSVELPVRALFDTPTVAGLAAAIVQQRLSDPALLPPPLHAQPRPEPLPLSFAQQRLWFLDQLEPNSPAYNIPSAIHIHGPLDVAAFQASLDLIVQRHETLRTTFRTIDGQPAQVISAAQSIDLPLIDLAALYPEASRDDLMAEALRRANAEAQRAFDLQHGPLLHAELLCLAADEHVLLLNMHHIIADGWSISVFMRELTDMYSVMSAAATSAPISTHAALAVQYADYALWQRQWLQGVVLDQQLGYWRQQLAQLAPLELPTDFSRPAVTSLRGSAHEFVLDPALAEALRVVSRREGATLFMTLLTAWQLLLARYSGQHDIAVGTPIAGRSQRETEHLIGCFINTVVLRTDLSDARTFREALRQVREVCLQAYAHQDVPFEQVVDAVQPERDLSRHPLFQVMFTLQTAPRQSLKIGALSLSPLTIEYGISKFDLSLSLAESGAELAGILEYSSDLFDAETIARMAGHYQTLLAALIAQPTQSLSGLALLTAAEQRQMQTWQTTPGTPVAWDGGVPAWFVAQAQRTPDAVALQFGDTTLSYGAVLRQASQLAQRLQPHCTGAEPRVALLLERTPQLVVALLATWLAGAAYVPLDPAYPVARRAFVLQDAQPTLLLTEHALCPPASERPDLPTLVLDDPAEQAALAALPATVPTVERTPATLAYLIYTSGTTGTPKAVLVAHGQLAHTLGVSQQVFAFQSTDTQPWLAAVTFDIALFELLLPLLAGGTTDLLAADTVRDPAALLARLPRWTRLHAVPSLLQQLVSAVDAAGGASVVGARLGQIFVGGDAVPAALLRQTQTTFPQAQLTVLYGPTEATIIATHYAVPRTADPQPLLGRPLPHVTVQVRDAHGQPVPVGVPGELWLGGPGVTLGYLNQAALTAERFVLADGQRWYRTGDRVRWLPDGTLAFLGRTDAQVKIRGYRIETGEVEAVLAAHPTIRSAVVIAREDTPGDKRLVAYLVPHNDATVPETSVLHTFLQTTLPDYMVPSAFVALEALPLTPNGKLDRRALPAPDTARPALADTFVAPRTPIEHTLANIWAEVLRLEQVGIHDNFFHLGGDSILSIQIVARATAAGLQLTPKQLFQQQTIAELATVVGTTALVQAEQGLVRGAAPLTPIQAHFFAQQRPDLHHFNQDVLLQATEALDPVLLAEALAALHTQHDALRLRFTAHADGWQQHHAPSPPAAAALLHQLDLRPLPAAEHDVARLAAATAAQTSLDLADGPLLRALLVTPADAQPQQLLLVVHHLVVDAVSWSILLADLETAYRQLRAGQAVTFLPKTSAFAHWAQQLQQEATTAARRDELPFWRHTVQTPVPALPLDTPHGVNDLASMRQLVATLSVAETQALLSAPAQAYQLQVPDVLLTALAQTWQRWTGQPRLRLDLEGHGREELSVALDLTRTVGWFTSLYPVLLDLDDARDPGAALKTVKEQLRAVPGRGLGYGLLRYLATDADASPLRSHPPTPISFNYLGQIDQTVARDSLFEMTHGVRGPSESPLGVQTYLLQINGMISEGQLRISWSYSAALHERTTIERIVHLYMDTLRALIAHCQGPDTGDYTPSDFAEYQWNQNDLDDITAAIAKSLGVV